MLNDLDKVDWSSLNGAYGPSTSVPQMLRSIINAPDGESFGDAYGKFLNVVNHQGSIYQVTSYTVPFLLNLLKQEKDIGRQLTYLSTLIGYVQSARTEEITWFSPVASTRPPIRYRYELAVHDAVCDGLDLYVSFLSHPDMGLSGLSMYLLTFLAGQHDRAIPPLQEYAHNQENPHLRAGAVWGIARLWKEANDRWEHDDRADWLKPFIEHDTDLRVRAVSALAYVQLKHINRDWPAFIIKELAESLAYTRDESEVYLGPYCFYQEAFLPFEGDWIRELGRTALAINCGFLVQLVKHSDAPPRLMHRLIRELLDITFWRNKLELWGEPDPASAGDNNEAIIYQTSTVTAARYQPGKKLGVFQQQALQAIVDCDAFWEIPTNIFSFFYDLPDEREALRELLT